MKKLILISAIALSALMTSAQTPSVSTRPAPVGGVNTHVIESNISVAATRFQNSQALKGNKMIPSDNSLKGDQMIPTMFWVKYLRIKFIIIRMYAGSIIGMTEPVAQR